MYRRHLGGQCRLEAGVTTRTAGILPAWRGCRREAGATSNSVRRRVPHPLSLAQRQVMLSTGKSPGFLPVGRDCTIPARYFLPVGNGFRRAPAKVTRRQLRRGLREPLGRMNICRRYVRPVPSGLAVGRTKPDWPARAFVKVAAKPSRALPPPATRICGTS